MMIEESGGVVGGGIEMKESKEKSFMYYVNDGVSSHPPISLLSIYPSIHPPTQTPSLQ